MILEGQRIFTQFLDMLHSFGLKINDDLPRRYAGHGYILSSSEVEHSMFLYGKAIHTTLSSGLTSILELCYTLQYMEENGRSQGDPWSSRQAGIYQQVDLKTRKSVWVLIQPPRSTRKSLEEALQSDDRNFCSSSSNPMLLHATILLTTADNWEDYLKHLYSQVQVLVNGPFFAISLSPRMLIDVR